MVNLNYIIIYILGLYIGYFINVCADQFPKGELRIVPPLGTSHCIRLSYIKKYIPILHYFYKKGKEENNATINPRYLIAEFLIAVLSVLIYHQFGLSLRAIPVFLLVYLLAVISIIDLDSLIIPDIINVFIGILGVLFMVLGWTVSFTQGILGLIAGGGSLLLMGYLSLCILKKEGMGGGDIKLMAVCGLYLGVRKTFFALLCTGYIGGIVLLFLIVLKKLKKNQYIPFGPFLSGGIIIALLFYENFMNLYLKLLL